MPQNFSSTPSSGSIVEEANGPVIFLFAAAYPYTQFTIGLSPIAKSGKHPNYQRELIVIIIL